MDPIAPPSHFTVPAKVNQPVFLVSMTAKLLINFKSDLASGSDLGWSGNLIPVRSAADIRTVEEL